MKHLVLAAFSARFVSSKFVQVKALAELHKAVEATKFPEALRPKAWMADVDPAILNINQIRTHLKQIYTELDGDSLHEYAVFVEIKKILDRAELEADSEEKVRPWPCSCNPYGESLLQL